MRLMCALSMIGVIHLACGGILEPDRDTDAPLQTDRLSYALTADDLGLYSTGTIEVEIVNTSEAPAYLTRGARRLDLVLEGLEGGEWVKVWGRTIPDAGATPLRLDPGESATFATEIEGFLPGTCVCGPIITFGDGVYRLRIARDYVASFDEETYEEGDELPLEHRVSNRFFLDSPN